MKKTNITQIIRHLLPFVFIALSSASFARERNYHFDGSISREVIDNYLSRAITMSAWLHGIGDPDDNIRMLRNTGAKFIGRSILRWGGEINYRKSLQKHVRSPDDYMKPIPT